MYIVELNKKATKSIDKMPEKIQEKFFALVKDLEDKGPVQKSWPNFSKLKNQENNYHCHLSYHWVACWRHEKNTIIIEVYYAGSRENAPY